jgi:hypothetical protein
MARKPTEGEPRAETISYRVTKTFYGKVIDRVDKSDEANLSDYARVALEERMKREADEEKGKT